MTSSRPWNRAPAALFLRHRAAPRPQKPSATQQEEQLVNNRKRVKSAISLAIVLAGTLAVVACNTVEGAGKDVQAGGSAVSDTARDTKHNMSD
jgi:predicted small secreted protein